MLIRDELLGDKNDENKTIIGLKLIKDYSNYEVIMMKIRL